MEIMPSPTGAPARGRYHHGDLRNALLETSLALVAEQGVERFSLREAARAVGVSPAAAYRHFEDKDALLDALAHDAFGRLALVMERAIARAPGAPGTAAHAAAVFVAVGNAYIEFAVQHPSYFRVMFGPWCDHEDDPTEQFEVPSGRDPYRILVDTLDALVATGAVEAEARAGAEIAAWSAVHGLAALIVAGSLKLTRAERGQAVRHVTRTLLAGLGCEAALLGPTEPALDTDPCVRLQGAKKR
jgi:AcrR family transcriptional regulator